MYDLFTNVAEMHSMFSEKLFVSRLLLHHSCLLKIRGVGTGGAKGAKAPPTLKITQKVPFSFEVKCPFSL